MLNEVKTIAIAPAYARAGDAAPRPDNSRKSFAEVYASVTESATTAAASKHGVPAQADIAGNYRNKLLDSARADPAEAEKLLAFNTAPNSGTFPLIDISAWPTVRYSVSGELQTPESEAYFAGVAASASKARVDLLQQERAKGTPPAEILDKVLALNSALPPRYKAMANITY